MAILTGVATTAAAITWLAVRLLHRCAARHPHIIRTLCAGAAPSLGVAAGVILHAIDAAAHPKSDWPAMALSGTTVLSAMSLLVTVPLAMFLLERRTRDEEDEADGM